MTAAMIHLWSFPDHFLLWWGYGVFFLAAVPAAAASLTLSASPAKIDHGKKTTLSGKLTSGSEPVPGKRVIVEQKPAGATKFSKTPGQPTAGLLTNSQGNFKLTGVAPKKNTDYRLRFAGAKGLKASTSPVQRVGVKVVLTLDAPPASVKAGSAVRLTGSVTPSHTGTVKLLIKRGTSTVATRDVELGSSRYALSYKPASTGNYSVAASFARDDDHLGDRSPIRKFKAVR